MYHEISTTPDPRFLRYTVTPAAFAAQVAWLSDHGYETILPARLVAARSGVEPLPERPVMLTFDDGFRAAMNHALQILDSHGFRAVFYLVSGFMESSSRWMVPHVGLELPIATWQTARALQQAGHCCASHTVSHPRLAELSPDACRDELVRSKAALEEHLGVEVSDLAYPFGSHSENVADLAAEAGYRTAVTTLPGFATRESLLTLRRIIVAGDDSMLDFRARMRTGMNVGELLQAARARVRTRR